jgi:maltooligosyltrehalose synthase
MTWTIAAAPRFPGKLSRLSWPSLGKGSLSDTELSFPPNAPRHWINIFTGEKIEVSGNGRVPMATVLRRFPVALLTALPD